MPLQKGHQKFGGRKKGTPNKRTQDFIDILERRKFSTADAMIDVYRKAMRAFKDNRGASAGNCPDMTFKYLEIAAKVAGDLMQYQFPKRKAVEHTGEGGQPLFQSLTDLVNAATRAKTDEHKP